MKCQKLGGCKNNAVYTVDLGNDEIKSLCPEHTCEISELIIRLYHSEEIIDQTVY